MSARFPSFSKQKKQDETFVAGFRKAWTHQPCETPPPNFFETSPHLHGGVAQIRTGAAEVATKLLADLVVRGWKGFCDN